MKLILIMLVSVCCALSVTAQQNNVFKIKPWENYKKKELSDKLKWQSPAFNANPSFEYQKQLKNSMVLKLPLSGTFIGKSNKGDDIYVLQPYNMPCLVPGKSFASNMPVLGKSGGSPSISLSNSLEKAE